jgi:hypothetical protein
MHVRVCPLFQALNDMNKRPLSGSVTTGGNVVYEGGRRPASLVQPRTSATGDCFPEFGQTLRAPLKDMVRTCAIARINLLDDLLICLT